MTIGTPSSQADYVIESSGGQISTGTTTSSTPAVERIGFSFAVFLSDFSSRLRGIRVRAMNDNPIYVLVTMAYNDFGIFRSLVGYSSYLVHPNNEFPTEGDHVYFAVSTESTPETTDRLSNILLVGNQDATSIRITPARDVSLPVDAQTDSSLIEVAAGTTHNISLNSFQTLGFFTDLDLTGTKVVSDKPLTVITGHQCAQIPPTTGFCEPMYIHLLPTFNWGQAFLLAPFGGRAADQYYRLVTSEDSTTIDYRCGSGNSVSLQHSTAGSFSMLSFPSNSYCYLFANNPIFVVQMSPGNEADLDGVGDPALAIVSPTTGHVRSASFFNFPTDFQNNFITVTVQAEHFDSSQILLDGTPLACTWNAILNTFSDDIIGHGCTFTTSSGTHTVTHSREDGVISAVTYGWNSSPALGYAYLTNYNLELQGILMNSFIGLKKRDFACRVV